MKRRKFLALGLAAAPALALPPAFAQPKYPERPIRLVIPFASGGSNDLIGRPWADKMRSQLGTIVVENVGGAGGAIGATAASRAPPDGYTLLIGTGSTQVIIPIASKRKAYDPIKDFEPIAILAVNSLSIAVHPSVPARTLTELVAYARANPGKLSYGSAGVGTVNHLAGELFKSLTGIADIVHVPYKGGAASIADAVSGQIPMIVSIVTGQIVELNATGKLRLLAVAAEKRLAVAPGIPTAIEQGLPGMIGTGFIGLFAPAGTPRPIVDQISRASRAVMADAEMQRLITNSGFEPDHNPSPEKTRRFLADEIARWTPIIRSIGLALD
jgi:tripartite-type tricarboxylate transporter receptor subunit TctC